MSADECITPSDSTEIPVSGNGYVDLISEIWKLCPPPTFQYLIICSVCLFFADLYMMLSCHKSHLFLLLDLLKLKNIRLQNSMTPKTIQMETVHSLKRVTQVLSSQECSVFACQQSNYFAQILRSFKYPLVMFYLLTNVYTMDYSQVHSCENVKLFGFWI